MTTTIREAEKDMRDDSKRSRIRRGASALLAAALLVPLAACEVTNPGPVADENLDLSTVHQSIVNGAGRKMSQAISFVGYTGGLSSREIIAGGQTGNGGHDAITQAGQLLPTNNTNHWGYVQTARWIAEDAVRRFAGLPAGQVDAAVWAEAYLWAGYANRMLGENFCEAVFDGGPLQANVEYFKRAEKHFTDAINKAPATAAGTNFKTAAYAGRASVRVFLKDWTGAVADANQVPLAYKFLVNADVASEDTRNQIYFVSSNTPYRGYSVWNTYFQQYYDQTGDPRVPYGKDPTVPFANSQLSGYGAVPWWFQLKYKGNNDDFVASSGREMVLIRAEALLNAGDFQGAMTLINSIRTVLKSDKAGNANLTPWVASNITDAWTFLKRERGIEMWLEARRLGDIRRWKENNTPGVLDWPNFEGLKKPDGTDGGKLFRDYPPSLCFPTPQNEIDTNPNF
jgi:starch-binding outer membrane protein, SusD/RagB family